MCIYASNNKFIQLDNTLKIKANEIYENSNNWYIFIYIS